MKRRQPVEQEMTLLQRIRACNAELRPLRELLGAATAAGDEVEVERLWSEADVVHRRYGLHSVEGFIALVEDDADEEPDPRVSA